MRARGSNPRGGPSRGSPARSPGGGTHRGGRQPTRVTRRDGRGAPNRVVTVPLEFRRQTLDPERRRLATVWKNETGCEVIPHSEPGPARTIITQFELYGTGDKLDQATQRIEGWIRQSVTKSSETTAWAKIPAHIAKDWSHDYNQKEQDEWKKKFTGDVKEEESYIYKSLVTMDWPKELRDAEVMMKDAFGPGLVNLDPIRMSEEVFIRPVGMSQLEIRGSDINRARSAEQRILVLFEKVRLKTNNKNAYPEYVLLDEREASEDGVIYEQTRSWWPDRLTHPIVPRLLRCALTRSQPGEYWQDLPYDEQYKIQSEFKRALDVARYEKGAYDLCIRFGCLALKEDISRIGTKSEKDVFMKNIIQKKELDCVVKHWLVDDEGGEELLARLMVADHLLEPTIANNSFGIASKPGALSETKCTLRGTWVFKDPHKLPALSSDYVVQVHWTVDEDGMYEKEYIKFYRLDPGRIAPKEKVDIKLLELGESKAWQFSLTCMSPVSKPVVPTALRDFANQARVRSSYDTGSKARFVDFKASPSLKILTGRLDKIYTFGLKKTCYKLDVISMWYPGTKNPCWGLNIYHNDWKIHLATAEHLRPGECAPWGDTVSTFLPDDGISCPGVTTQKETHEEDKNEKLLPADGIRLLFTKLTELSQFIFEADDMQVPDYPAISPVPLDRPSGQESLISRK